MSQPKPYWNPYISGVLLGLVLAASFLVTGHGLGASGGLGRVVGAAIDSVAPGHVDTNPYLAPIAGGDTNPFDNWGIPVLLGTLLGGFVSGLLGGRVRAETFKGPRVSVRQRWVFAVIGGILVGFGARLARGCTSGQALSGGAMLSLGSWAFMFSVFIGGYAVAWFVRRLWTGGE
jgi:uncharacterized membrane protein YedE/YeeE